jgi:hypothetical protein
MKTLFSIFIFFFSYTASFAQGRVVVNEFMAWSGCANNSEFIELLNFGPGPMDIGCYIVTNGQYAVTIPPNTIIKPGQYFLLAGQNILNKNCGNVDSTVIVDLNWSACNCTDKPIPAGGVFMSDGGSVNEKIVLLDPSWNVIDAVSRNLPASSSSAITTSSNAGACASKTFDLDTMNINYEFIGNSTGKDNSFSRKVDGDCGWVKTTQISAAAPNKTGSTSSATYIFSTLTASECKGTDGSIAITVSAADVNALFPMNYVLAFDADSNGVFNESDEYRYGADSSAPHINIDHLKYGRYKITVGSALGCNLKSFDFFIFNCYGVVLPLQLTSFAVSKENQQVHASWSLTKVENVEKIIIERSADGISFIPVQTIAAPPGIIGHWSSSYTFTDADAAMPYFRLRIYNKLNEHFLSQVVFAASTSPAKFRVWPNPAKDILHAEFMATNPGFIQYKIYSFSSQLISDGQKIIHRGNNVVSFPTENLAPGNYQLQIFIKGNEYPLRMSFVKK